MITIVSINVKKQHEGVKSYFDNVIGAWNDRNDKTTRIKHIENIKDLNVPAKDVIIFHPRATHGNPEWFKEVENFMDFDFPEDKYYVFGSDSGNIIEDIDKNKSEFKTCRFVKVPVGQGFRSIHAHIVCAIVLWERFKRRSTIPSIKEW